MNLRDILIRWIVAIASLLFFQHINNLRFRNWLYRSTAERKQMLVLFLELLFLSIKISPFINEQIIKLRKNL
jgi:hypothetical protein